MRIPKATLEQWRVLQAIIDHGGYAQAAEALHRSQSSISYAVARLQEQLGVELLVIEGRKAQLTDHGRALLAAAGELLADAQRLEGLAQSLMQGWEPEIRLVVDVVFPNALLLQILSAFTRIAPQTRIQLKEVVLSGAEEALQAQEADVVIGTRVPPTHLGDHLLDVQFIAVAHPDHALHRLGRSLDAEDLRRELQVVLRDSGTVKPRDEGWLGATQRWTVTSLQTSVSMVGAGLGFAWLPRHLIADQLSAGELLPLPLSEGGTRQVSLYLLFGKPGQPGRGAKELAEVVRQMVSRREAPPA
jgi:DNA-binding transcriptional LysR family regulator